MPLKEDKVILRNSILGASVGLLLNLCIVRVLQSVGSTIVWGISELSILASAQYFLGRHYSIRLPFGKILKMLACNIPLLVILLLFHSLSLNVFLAVIVAFFICIAYTFVLQYYMLKTTVLINICQGVWHRIFSMA